jgi:branched-chain amino acid transport system ATP-binding protein
MPTLSINRLDVRYGQIQATRELSFSVGAGEIVALVGANGAGKSSTLKAIIGIADADGEINWDGRSLIGLPPADIVRAGVGYSPEGRRVFPGMSVYENLRVGAFSRPSDEFEDRLQTVYGYFPRLKERAGQRASSLSGGEQQMLAIGRALMSKPALFLIDEPSLGLAPIIVDRIGKLLHEIRDREGLSVVLAEQNANWAMRVADRSVIMDLGQKTIEGTKEQLINDPAIRTAYLGLSA